MSDTETTQMFIDEYSPPAFDMPDDIRFFINKSRMLPFVHNLNVDTQTKYPQLRRIAVALEDGLRSYDKLYKDDISEVERYLYGESAIFNFCFVAQTCGGMLQYRMPFPDEQSDLGLRLIVSDVQYLEAHAWYYAYLSSRRIEKLNVALLCLEKACEPMLRQYRYNPKLVYFIVNYLDTVVQDPMQHTRIQGLYDLAQDVIRRIQNSQKYRNQTKYVKYIDLIKTFLETCKDHIPIMQEEFNKELDFAHKVKRAKIEKESPPQVYNPFDKSDSINLSYLFSNDK